MSTRRFASHPEHRGQLVVLDDDPRLDRYWLQAVVDFGRADGGEETFATTTVAASWTTEERPTSCYPAGELTEDHSPVDAVLEGLAVYVANRVPGQGFDLVAYAPNGTWGRHLITVVG